MKYDLEAAARALGKAGLPIPLEARRQANVHLFQAFDILMKENGWEIQISPVKEPLNIRVERDGFCFCLVEDEKADLEILYGPTASRLLSSKVSFVYDRSGAIKTSDNTDALVFLAKEIAWFYENRNHEQDARATSRRLFSDPAGY